MLRSLNQQPDMRVSVVLTRRALTSIQDHPAPTLLTNRPTALLRQVDLVVECSGDPIYATVIIEACISAGIPVVTLNTEFHVTTGSYFAGKGLLSEAEGDQPGSLARMYDEALYQGFFPWVIGNVKGFYNPTPTESDMRHWAKKQGISLSVVTSATDGTKVQYEQALLANGLGASILQEGFVGLPATDLHTAGEKLARQARSNRSPISDYVLFPKSPARIFIVAEHEDEQQSALEYLKMGTGPFYILQRDRILTYLEVPTTIRQMLRGGPPLLDNGTNPKISVAAITKRDLRAETYIKNGVGGFDLRGIAVRKQDRPQHVPFGLIQNATITRDLPEGSMVTWDDIELPPSRALEIWRSFAIPHHASLNRRDHDV